MHTSQASQRCEWDPSRDGEHEAASLIFQKRNCCCPVHLKPHVTSNVQYLATAHQALSGRATILHMLPRASQIRSSPGLRTLRARQRRPNGSLDNHTVPYKETKNFSSQLGKLSYMYSGLSPSSAALHRHASGLTPAPAETSVAQSLHTERRCKAA